MNNGFSSQRQELSSSSSLKRRWQHVGRARAGPTLLSTIPNITEDYPRNASTTSSASGGGLRINPPGRGRGRGRGPAPTLPLLSMSISKNSNHTQGFPGGFDDDDLVSMVVPPVTVVFEGRSICHRISLEKHTGYKSLAKALRHMFVGDQGGAGTCPGPVDANGLTTSSSSTHVNISDHLLDLSNAIPGYLIAYEDMEDDLLLAGDLNWKDFVRVAKRIRILPTKSNSRNGRVAAAAVN